MTAAIQFDHVSKFFNLHIDRPRSFQERFVGLFKPRSNSTQFWALRDVSFAIAPGEAVGLIGENGAGKSTALKLMARTLSPTSGQVRINGRIGALLELGAGFHPDLTGRENIYLSGSIMGLKRRQIERGLDEIIAFAELERFIDVPVKHYSSGMYVRLGFAVAVYTNPDILLVDEVLAVGDAHFQQRCLDRIEQMRQQGVTIILVSHGMRQVYDICDKAFWIDDGAIRAEGASQQVIQDYLRESSPEEYIRFMEIAAVEPPPEPEPLPVIVEHPLIIQEPPPPMPIEAPLRWGDGQILIQAVRLLDSDGQPADVFHPEQSLSIEIDYGVHTPVPEFPAFGIAIYRADGVWCYGTNTALDAICFPHAELPAAGTVIVELLQLQLLPGEYTVDVAVHAAAGRVHYDYIRQSARFRVTSDRGDQGVFRPQICWHLKSKETGYE